MMRSARGPDASRRSHANPDLFPEVQAGGYTRIDGTVAFYSRVRALLMDCSAAVPTVLDFGAGRGRFLEDSCLFRRTVRRLQTDAHVIGVDVDPVVLRNESLDDAYVIRAGEPLPLADASVDFVVCDFTFEHVDDPADVAVEFARVLKPGGWICARTPNRWGYIAVGARLVPNALHIAALRRLQPNKRAHDTFPTRYHLNTPAQVRNYFPPPDFEVIAYGADGPPGYSAGRKGLAKAFRLWGRIAPERLATMLFIFIRKADTA